VNHVLSGYYLYASRTARLAYAQQEEAMALRGQAGARLLTYLYMSKGHDMGPEGKFW
jgi:hypothetical protein